MKFGICLSVKSLHMFISETLSFVCFVKTCDEQYIHNNTDPIVKKEYIYLHPFHLSHTGVDFALNHAVHLVIVLFLRKGQKLALLALL